MKGALDVFLVFLRLGFTSLGGPVAHLGYFRTEFVERRRWLDEPSYAALVGLCQFLPGPTSSQVGMAIGLQRAGTPGAFAAFLGFTLPSAALMIAFAYLLGTLGDVQAAPWLHGLKLAAAAVVAQAVWSMARTLTPDAARILLAAVSAAIVLFLPTALGQVSAIALAALIGAAAFRARTPAAAAVPLAFHFPRAVSVIALALFFGLLAAFPLLAPRDHTLAVVDAFYRTGALVFGGGHVVLPLLQQAVADPGWIDRTAFLAGYGAAQAMPGPLFSFAAFLGVQLKTWPNGLAGAALALAAIYLSSFLLVFGAVPLWSAAQRFTTIRAAVTGINAAVVGLLAAALYTPVWTSAVHDIGDVAIVAALFLLLLRRVPSWVVVAIAVLFAVIARAAG